MAAGRKSTMAGKWIHMCLGKYRSTYMYLDIAYVYKLALTNQWYLCEYVKEYALSVKVGV